MKKRFMSFMVVNGLLIMIWTVYLFTVQITDPYGFEQRRQVRYTPAKELQIPARGYIYDRNSELLVRTCRFYQIDYDRSTLNSETRTEDCRIIAQIISDNSSLSFNFVFSRLSGSTGPASVYISDRIRESDFINIERELREHRYHRGLISSFSFQQRTYSKESLAARLLGVVRERRDTESSGSTKLSFLEGLSGIESTYDNELRGTYGWRKLLYDAGNNPIVIPGLRRQKVNNGNNLILTIDSRVQEIVEMTLREGLETYNAKNGIGVVMNPKTGEIIAMASVSGNDKKLTHNEIRGLPNPAVSFMFEPGSTIKPFTALAALEKRLFVTSDTLDCRTYRLPGRTIRDSHPFKRLSFRDVIVHSSNVGTSKIAEKIGSEDLYKLFASLGFGSRTGSDIYGESSGLFRKLRDWQGFSLHSISFGQEMSVTALQLATAYATIANNGVMMKPYIVKAIVDEDRNVVSMNRPTRIRTVSNKTAIDTLHTILRDVVEQGTGKSTRLPYISIGGKTGTAEKQSGTAGYTQGKYVANFAGFFPLEDPQMVGVVIYDEPAYYYRYASMSATVSFRKITEQILSLPNCSIMPAARSFTREFVSVPDVMGLSPGKAAEILKEAGVQYQIVKSTDRTLSCPYSDKLTIVNQYPKEGVELEKSQQLIVVVDNVSARTSISGLESDAENAPDFDGLMPKLVGKTLRQAISLSKKSYVRLKVKGSGTIVQQSIPAGSKINYGEECIVIAR